MKKTGKKIINGKEISIKFGYGETLPAKRSAVIALRFYKRFAFCLDRDINIRVLDWFKPIKSDFYLLPEKVVKPKVVKDVKLVNKKKEEKKLVSSEKTKA